MITMYACMHNDYKYFVNNDINCTAVVTYALSNELAIPQLCEMCTPQLSGYQYMLYLTTTTTAHIYKPYKLVTSLITQCSTTPNG